jgi:hypothetical protein
MGFIKARGRNFYYEERGDGPPVLHPPSQCCRLPGSGSAVAAPLGRSTTWSALTAGRVR